MEIINNCIETLLTTDDHDCIKNNSNALYRLLSQIKLGDDVDSFVTIIPKLFMLISTKKIQRDLMYLSLLPNNDRVILNQLIAYEKSNFTLAIENPTSLFDYCLFTNQHWFLDVVQNANTMQKDIFSNEILSVVNILQLIEVSNKSVIDFNAIQSRLQEINLIHNKFIDYYRNELNRVLDIVEFCQKYLTSSDAIYLSEIYHYASNKSLLETFAQFLDLKSRDTYEDILSKLQAYKTETELEILTAYIIIFNILQCLEICKNVSKDKTIKTGDEISSIIHETEIKLINIKSLNLQVEILENIFSLLFLQPEHFIENADVNLNTSSHFYCTENEVRLILVFLKSVCDEIKRKILFNNTSDEFKRFTELNKHLADAIWRFELVTHSDCKNYSKAQIESNIISYMLAPPQSLIHLCLKQNNFNKAHQVIQIFNLQDSQICTEVNYNARLLQQREHLQKAFKIRNLQKDRPNIYLQETVPTTSASIEDFFKSNIINESCEQACKIDRDNPLTWYCDLNNMKFMDVMDLAITLPDTYEKCEDLMNTALNYYNPDSNTEILYIKFYNRVLQLFNEINKKYTVSIRDILCDTEFDLDLQQYEKNETFFEELQNLCDVFIKQLDTDSTGKFNNKHISHKTLFKINKLCSSFQNKTGDESKDQIKYLQRLFNYLKGFSKILYVERNNSDIISMHKDVSYFEILNRSRVDILEKLLFVKKLDVSDFEQLFSKLKLDLVYHVAAIFFPKVNLLSAEQENQAVAVSIQPNTSILSYIQKRNWLLAFVLREMYKTGGNKLDLNEIRIKTFVNFLKLPRIQNLRVLYKDNEVVTALHHQISTDLLKSYFEQHIIKLEVEDATQQAILGSQISTGSLETGEEIFEGDLKITNWKHLYDVINSLPEYQLQKNEELLDMRNLVLNELVGDCFEVDYYKYVQFISDNYLRWECILNNLTTWPGQFCLDIIKSELSGHSKPEKECVEQFVSWYEKIELYENIRVSLQLNSWFEVMLLCKNKPQEILQSLLNTIEINFLLKFIDVHEINEDDLQIIDETYFVTLFDSNVDLSKIKDLLEKLPTNHATSICYALLKLLKKLECLSFVTNFILKTIQDDTDLLKSIQISLKILSCFNTMEQEQFWCLITDPMSMIEILIMNTKLEKLTQVLEEIKPDIENCEFDENQISIEKIDETLRMYAEKSLEFRVILQPGTKISRTPDSSKLLQSIDSINLPSGQRNFIIPETVPDKTQWVQNNEATECMCCLDSIFSMFNRRHHCRRCGRVVCGACSLKRMLVPTYGDIMVRVCIDCYEQSHQDGTGTSSSRSEASIRSHGYDYWLLTDNSNHNQIVREEFSYEYAPSVSLCLAILKCHSKNEEYPKFLLDQCDGMLRLLQPINSEAAQEIDYLLVIKMLKSLAIAAKMLSAQCMLQWGTSLADRILSQADLLSLLAERGCLHLIPTSPQSHSCYIDATTLRRLRDKLLELEQWNLALEVSTKAGLDNSGVFAAWGKTCLKAGCLQIAREKFQRCFDKTAHYESSTELSASFSSIQIPHFHNKLLMPTDNRPTKNPPLLNEIIHILESNTCIIDAKILQDVKNTKPLSSSMWSLNSSVNLPLQSDPAVCILNKLKNLSSIAAGNYCSLSDNTDSLKSINITKPHLEPLFYEECIYYLTKYGTHMSLLEFYIKHRNVHQCMQYMLENRLSSDIFIEIYMSCLRENLIGALQESMCRIDSTLDVWKDYLKHICRHLEKQSKLHSLYQLQQFMGDFIRAAMTCIKFYKDESTTYTELTSKINYLHKAQQHLQQELEQEQWVEVASVRKTSLDSQESFEAKGIANPSLVMRMDSKNIDKHINTIWRQIEVAKFLAECESSGTPVSEILPEILPYINEDLPASEVNKVKIPTLFGTYYERVQLAVLAIVCGTNVEDGFGIAFRIIHDHKLNPVKVYCQAGRQLAKTERYSNIAQLVSCIRSSGVSDSAVTDMCDEMLILAVQTLTKANITGPQLDALIKLITDRAAKISAYIESKQLKTAYLLAVKHKRISDIRRILREAEFLNQPAIKVLCQKILHAHSHSPSHSKD